MRALRDRLALALGPNFVLGEELGGGGMSRLFRAQDVALGRTVVVKLLSPELTAEISVERFLREIRVLASMQQANIVPLLSVGECDGIPWFMMPYIEGRSLRDRLADGPLPIDAIRDILRDVVRALAYAHGRGIIHRDIKPDNVLLSGGTAVVTDFGIARALGAAQTAGDRTTLTRDGTAVGTPAYMAPEQIAGDATIDARADFYALGCMVYELLTGAPPFHALPPSQMFTAHLTATPESVIVRRADTPVALADLVARCLAKKPDDRPANTDEVLALLGDSRGDAPRAATQVVRRRRMTVPLVVAAALLALIGYAYQKTRVSTVVSIPTVVVLPFTNAGADTSRQYLADGITDELIAGLARVNGLRVVARSVAFRYRGAEGDPRRVAQELNASAVLSGAVRMSGRGLHVVADLTRSDGSAAWTRTFDTDSNGVAAIEAQVIEAATQHLRVDLGETARSALARRAEQNPEAHDLYLRGRFFWTQRSEEGLRRAIELYRESIDREPKNTYALSGLADAYAVSAWYSYLSPEDGYGRARQIAAQALAIDSTLAEPNASLGYVALYYDWDWTKAQRLFQRSIALDSTYATAHQWYGNYHIAMGELPQAIAEFRAAEQLDPANRISTAAVCWGLLFAHRARDAVAQCQRGLDLDSTLAVAHLWRGQALELLADTVAAITELETAVRLGHRSAVTVAGLAHAKARFGQGTAARTLLSELESLTGRYRPSYEIATVYAALGERDQAIRFLERAITERAHSLVLMAVDPALDPMRDDPRLTAIIRRVGLTPMDATR